MDYTVGIQARCLGIMVHALCSILDMGKLAELQKGRQVWLKICPSGYRQM